MEPQVEFLLTSDKIASVNRNIDPLSDKYIITILLKLRKYLRNGPFNDRNVPYDSAIVPGSSPLSGVNRFNTRTSTLQPMDLQSYITGNTYLLPAHILEMLNTIESASIGKKDKLKQIYQHCIDAAEKQPLSRADSTHFHYATLRRFIEIMVDPFYRNTYQKIVSSEFEASAEFFETLRKKLLSGPNNSESNPYTLGIGGGTKIQTAPDTYVKVPKHVDVILCEIHDVIRDGNQKLQKIYFGLIDAVLSYSKKRDESTQKFYEKVFKEFVQQINANGISARAENDSELRL